MVKTSRKVFFSAAAGIIIAFCYAAGKPLDLYDSLDLSDKSFYLRWALLTIMVSVLVYMTWEIFRWLSKRTAPVLERQKIGNHFKNEKCVYGFCVLFLLICWFPAFLSLFPGAFAYDAREEWLQVSLGNITSHHPVVHVLLLGGLVEMGYRLVGSYNTGIAVYTILQMILMAFVLTYTLRFLKEFGVPKIFRFTALLFYGFSPVMQLFAISATKDVLFTGAELMFFLSAIRFCCRREEMFQSKKHMSVFCISAFLTMILRKNGLYIVLVMLVILAFLCRKDWKKAAKKLSMMFLGIILPYLLYIGPFYSLLGVTSGGVEEMLSVPLQQMARVYSYDYDMLEQEDLELLYSIVPEENLKAYRATVSDYVKTGFQRESFEENKADFIKLWIKWGVSHPLTYINSFLINTVDAWYPGAVIDGYRHSYGRSSYFDYQVDKPGEERIFLKGLHEYYRSISHDAEAQRKPFAFLILSPGWYFVMFLVLFFYLWCERQYKLLVPWIMMLLHFGTVLLGPMALVRYMLIFYYAFPVFAACVLFGKKEWQRT